MHWPPLRDAPFARWRIFVARRFQRKIASSHILIYRRSCLRWQSRASCLLEGWNWMMMEPFLLTFPLCNVFLFGCEVSFFCWPERKIYCILSFWGLGNFWEAKLLNFGSRTWKICISDWSFYSHIPAIIMLISTTRVMWMNHPHSENLGRSTGGSGDWRFKNFIQLSRQREEP